MFNFGYPYNDIVICKDSTDYLPYNINQRNVSHIKLSKYCVIDVRLKKMKGLPVGGKYPTLRIELDFDQSNHVYYIRF